jgi:stalled ribosome rescue protein Dom34
MSNEKQFGVWMDSQHATIIGKKEAGDFTVIEHVKGEETFHNSSERNANNHERMAQAKFFKEITSHMQNATEIHLTGTGKIQEHFIHYLADTPQFKNTKTGESTSNKMSDEKLIEFISEKMN